MNPDVKRFVQLVRNALKLGNNFTDAMIAGYIGGAVLPGVHLPGGEARAPGRYESRVETGILPLEFAAR